MTLLAQLHQAGTLSALSCVFARFIARHAAASEDSVLVLTAALLSESNQRGDVCIDLAALAGQPMFAILPGSDAIMAPALRAWQQELLSSGCVAKAGEQAPMLVDDGRLYLQRFWHYECAVFTAIEQRLGALEDLNEPLLKDGLDRLFPASAQGATAALDWQKLASALAVSRRFAVISGGPGTGKTTTVVKVLALLIEQKPDLRLRLAAPTGKAAARMVESIRAARQGLELAPEVAACLPDSASTLHRLLAYQGGSGAGGFRHNRDNPLLLDCLVIDEASMIDLPLMWALLEACQAHTRIILLGDRDQLASVEAGNVLGDITGHGQALHYSANMAELLQSLSGIDMARLPVSDEAPAVADSLALLRTSYRFQADSGIGALAEAVNAGAAQRALQLLEHASIDEQELALSDLVWLKPGNDARRLLHAQVLPWAVQRYRLYLECSNPADALHMLASTRILCAAHEGPLGQRELNRLVGERLRSAGLLDAGEQVHGTPIMITVNDYEMALYNGDIGLLWRSDAGRLEACFPELDGKVRHLPATSLPEYVRAWAMTVHKAQGSEFDEVLLVLPSEAKSPLLLRELLYTGITRAKRRLLLHTSSEALTKACHSPVQRSSGLAARLAWSAARQE